LQFKLNINQEILLQLIIVPVHSSHMKLKGQVERFAHEILLIQYFMQHAIDSSVVKSTIYEKSQNYTVKMLQ